MPCVEAGSGGGLGGGANTEWCRSKACSWDSTVESSSGGDNTILSWRFPHQRKQEEDFCQAEEDMRHRAEREVREKPTTTCDEVDVKEANFIRTTQICGTMLRTRGSSWTPWSRYASKKASEDPLKNFSYMTHLCSFVITVKLQTHSWSDPQRRGQHFSETCWTWINQERMSHQPADLLCLWV